MLESHCVDEYKLMADRKREIWFREQPGSLVCYKPVHWKAYALHATAMILWLGSAAAMGAFGLLQNDFALVLIPLIVVFFAHIIIAGLHTGRMNDSSAK
jgi:hypothetical protein